MRRRIGAAALVVTLVLAVIFVRPYTVPTDSMSPTLSPGDVILALRSGPGASFRWFTVNRGDVVVFPNPGKRDELHGGDGEAYSKRCIAVAGDTVVIRNSTIFINGSPLPYKRPPHDTTTVHNIWESFPRHQQWDKGQWGPYRVPAAGDTLILDEDGWKRWAVIVARDGFDVDEETRTVDGRVVTQHVLQHDFIFVVGDNTLNSVDSRVWGPIREDAVEALPLFVLFSTDSSRRLLQWIR